ncbi:MAG: radical SAM protein [Syntrophobacteraceae bacterium]
MKYCKALNGALNIERDRVQFCCATKQLMPTIPWDPDEELPLERIGIVRTALARTMNEDMDKPVPEYVEYGLHTKTGGHPCKNCRFIIETDEDIELPSSSRLTEFLHLQAFTYCNAKCVFCHLRSDAGGTPISRGYDLDKAVNRAVEQLFEADLVAPSCQVIFSNGEPSLSKETMKTLDSVTRKGLRVMINTNAISFAPEIAKALESGKALVQVSMDSGDRESYRKIKGVDKFNSVAQNIDRYASHVKGGSRFWIKYIIFSKNNSTEIMNNFIDFCINHRIKNVSVNADYCEGEDLIEGWDCLNTTSQANYDSLRSFAYLSSQLEYNGVCVHKEMDHFSQNEQELTKREYAIAVMKLLEHTSPITEENINNISYGCDLVLLPQDSNLLHDYFLTLLNKYDKNSKIALFGAGAHAMWICSLMDYMDIHPIVAFDNNPPHISPFGFSVVKPSEITKYDIDTVIIASNAYHLNIYAQMKKMPEFSKVKIIDPYLNITD